MEKNRWKNLITKSWKIITILEGTTNYSEVRAVARHEFGHVLGLGDLYEEDGVFEGVPEGTYYELDPYAGNSKYYNLVMCDHHAPVTNNDIEMVILAFRDNTAQLFQKGSDMGGKISDALGKGD